MASNKKSDQQLIAECRFNARYSGELSVRIWNEITKSTDRTLFDFALALQDVESRFLAVLNADIEARVKRLLLKQRRK